MSGWIKFDKDMVDDPRLTAAAAELATTFQVTGIGGPSMSYAEELSFARNALLGCLVTLWKYADTHIRDDDTLPLGSKALDAVVGLSGFSKLMPDQWLVELDDGRMQLPGYSAKNGLIAKRKIAEHNKARQAAWRARRKQNNAGSNASHDRNVTAPEQCDKGGRETVDQDQDQDQDIEQDKERITRDVTRDRPPGVPRGTMAKLRKLYPGTHTEANWLLAERSIEFLLESGANVDELVAAVIDYSMQQAAKGNTTHLYTPANFFSKGHWRGPFRAAVRPLRTADEIEAEQAQRDAAGGTRVAG